MFDQLPLSESRWIRKPAPVLLIDAARSGLREFLKRVILFFVLQALVFSGAAYVYWRYVPWKSNYVAATIEKHNLLETQSSPRIVLIGGSNLAFGIDSTAVQKQLRLNPVNMGLHLGLGLDFMLAEVAPSLRQGDVVIISPEYENFGDYFAGNAEALFTAILERPRNVHFLTAANYATLLDGGFIMIGQITRFASSILTRSFIAPSLSDSVYARMNFDRFGDMKAHYVLPPQASFDEPGHGDPIQNVPRDINHAIQRLNAFHAFCQRHGIRVYFSFPPFYEKEFHKNRSALGQIEIALRNRLSFPIVDTAEAMVFSGDNLYDNRYHLNRIGTRKRTQHLIDELRRLGE